jgi:aminopeptidase N
VPLASYGLEFPGIIAISDRIYDLDAEVNGIPTRALLESTVVHETAHQWFYGLVGNDQVREPWVDEATAQYATWLYFRDRYGAARAEAYFASFEQRWDRVGREKLPIGLGVAEYGEKAYGAIVYGRGPLFLRALSESMGEPVFDSFLREWVRRSTGAIATGGDFQRLATEVSGRDVGAIFDAWVWPAPQ